MRKLIFSLVVGALISRGEAQLFTPESWNGAVLGGLVGGIIGNNNHGRTGEGIAIGAGAGWLLGTLAHENRRARGWYSSDYVYVGPQAGEYAQPYFGVSPCYGYAPVYSFYHPGYAWNGAVLGGVAGAIIGNNSHGRTAEGAAIGAGAGLLLGSIADAEAIRRASRAPAMTMPSAKPAPLPRASSRAIAPPVPQSPHQIPDAPWVPDAPTF